jgi:hypothetical protein
MRAAQAIAALFKRKAQVTDQQIAAAMKRSRERTHRNRLPEKPGALLEYSRFVGKYMRENGATLEEANEACRKKHPEYWPDTVLQPAYSH